MNYRHWNILVLCLFLVQGLCASFATNSEEFKENSFLGRFSELTINRQIQQNIQNQEREEFHIFDVGQGNCQLALYGNIGILYDCGSSADRSFTKITEFETEEFNPVITNKSSQQVQDQPSFVQKSYFNQPNTPQKKEGEHEKTLLMTTGAKDRIGASETIKTKKYIKDFIQNAHLSHLFVFLSHPDKDHINYLPYVLEGLNECFLTAFLGGDWISHATQETSEALTFLHKKRNKENTHVEYPYFWNFSHPKAQKYHNYEKLKPHILNYNTVCKDMYKEYEYYKNNIVVKNLNKEVKKIKKDYQQGSNQYKEYMRQIGEKFKAINEQEVSISNKPLLLSLDHFKEKYKLPVIDNLNNPHDSPWHGTLTNLIDQRSPNSFKESLKESLNDNGLNILKNVYIWSLNHYGNDVNAQSIIMSFHLPKSRMNFICTGDAEEEVFVNLLIKQNIKKNIAEHLNELHKAQHQYYEKKTQYFGLPLLAEIDLRGRLVNNAVEREAGKALFQTQSISLDINQYLRLPVFSDEQSLLSILILPHHGASNNLSRTMFELFRPNVVVASAGHGIYDHPSRELNRYEDIAKEFQIKKIQELNFLVQHNIDTIIYFDEDSKARLKSFNYEDDTVMILSTNISGNIKANVDGITRNYNPLLIVERGDHKGRYMPCLAESVLKVDDFEKLTDIDPPHPSLAFYDSGSGKKLYYRTINKEKTEAWLYNVNKDQ